MSDPDLIKHVTVTNSKNYARSHYLRIVLPSIGNGLFSSNGKDHADQRKMINPAFNYGNLTGIVDDFEDVTANLVRVGCCCFFLSNRYKYLDFLTVKF